MSIAAKSVLYLLAGKPEHRQPLEPQNSLALAGQRLTESQRRCVEVETEALRSLRVILRTNLAMTPDP